ncbi:D-alanyl-D-alanine carboxypeptidase [Flagellimonas meridianipacifica]|uniref:D-alanyl-D-alanine carboxypeptidase n=1 Tax=Flagellimonas meridianipacifica TaxID=1080225 RepID=UPI001FE810A4|nr:D-alanyl-D-alanine carboxypeptidase [Allomuricauda pacifica]
MSTKEPFETSFHGLVVIDANSGKVLHSTNGDKYFIPASNVKIFTLFAAKKMLSKKAPALKYVFRNDTTYIKGTGYPASLHPYFNDSLGVFFLKKQQGISLSLPQNEIPRFGPGWAWEDYDTYFSPEINDFPLYGNVLTAYPENEKRIYPSILNDSVYVKNNPVGREEFSNTFYINQNNNDTLTIPFITAPIFTKKMLEDVLKQDVSISKVFPNSEPQILEGIETDSIAKRMMYVSDNFLAEQLLLMCSSTLSDTLSSKKTITHILENELSDLKNQPRWVDGSGLSRYNLFTPESMVHVLKKLYEELPSEKLFALFPSWNRDGTIETWEELQKPRYIFAKSGGMGNTYNLSGYLKTKSGKILIFSSMNNHFRVPSSKVREEIELILMSLWERY